MANAAAGNAMTETARMCMWRDAITKEQASSREHEQTWGFLFDKTSTGPSKPYGIVPIKYYNGASTSVVMKRLPMLPQDKVAEESAEVPKVEELISTRRFEETRPTSALESTLYSHAKNLDTIRTVDPFLKTTTQTYGSRLPIEQFGVSQYGRVDTAITRWDKRDLSQP